jgi:hypothetical protein
MGIDCRVALVGADRTRSAQGVLTAAGLFGLVLAVSAFPIGATGAVATGLVVAGFGLASWWAFDNSGLAVSVALVSAPVLARLTYNWWRYLGEPAPVALPLSFGGHGAWAMWVPLALLLGGVAFAVGAVLRRGRRFAAGPTEVSA